MNFGSVLGPASYKRRPVYPARGSVAALNLRQRGECCAAAAPHRTGSAAVSLTAPPRYDVVAIERQHLWASGNEERGGALACTTGAPNICIIR